jgi:hypothetical protein
MEQKATKQKKTYHSAQLCQDDPSSEWNLRGWMKFVTAHKLDQAKWDPRNSSRATRS